MQTLLEHSPLFWRIMCPNSSAEIQFCQVAKLDSLRQPFWLNLKGMAACHNLEPGGLSLTAGASARLGAIAGQLRKAEHLNLRSSCFCMEVSDLYMTNSASPDS